MLEESLIKNTANPYTDCNTSYNAITYNTQEDDVRECNRCQRDCCYCCWCIVMFILLCPGILYLFY